MTTMVVNDFLSQLLSFVPDAAYGSARKFHVEVERSLKMWGFETQREVLIQYKDRWIERRGRLDLVAHHECAEIEKGMVGLAIELDNRTARKKSILKVKAWAAENKGMGLVILRNPRSEDERFRLYGPWS